MILIFPCLGDVHVQSKIRSVKDYLDCDCHLGVELTFLSVGGTRAKVRGVGWTKDPRLKNHTLIKCSHFTCVPVLFVFQIHGQM